MFRTLSISRLERVALIRDGVFERLLGPGVFRFWTLGSVVELVKYEVDAVARQLEPTDPVPAELPGARLFEVSGRQVAILSWGGVDRQLLTAGRWRLWEQEGLAPSVRTYDFDARPVALADDDRLQLGQRFAWEEASASTAGQFALVLLRDGVPVEVLSPGRYRTWKGGPWELSAVDLGIQLVEPAAQDIVTRDEIPVRVKPAASWRVTDPLAMAEQTRDVAPLVYAAVQRALREVLAAYALDELTAARSDLSDALRDRAVAALPEGLPIALSQVWVKDIVLPGEVRDIVRQVTVAKKQAEAQAIRRREEVAATRQLANTAKLLEQSPVLLRLKELEAMGELIGQLSGKIDKLVLVGGDDLVSQLRLQTAVRAIDG
ncbi:MAG: slipin family protein [Alphaproteobacteria bacterium]|nr:slipin family protein [Alphaproteobacteria bacterium]